MAQAAWARPMIYSDAEMVGRATAIAYVHISTGGPNTGEDTLGGVQVTPIRTIKGALPARFQIHEGNQMECASRLSAGDYLIFVVKKDGRFWSANCGRSWRRIENGKVIWPASFKAGEKRWIELKDALNEITELATK